MGNEFSNEANQLDLFAGYDIPASYIVPARELYPRTPSSGITLEFARSAIEFYSRKNDPTFIDKWSVLRTLRAIGIMYAVRNLKHDAIIYPSASAFEAVIKLLERQRDNPAKDHNGQFVYNQVILHLTAVMEKKKILMNRMNK